MIETEESSGVRELISGKAYDRVISRGTGAHIWPLGRLTLLSLGVQCC